MATLDLARQAADLLKRVLTAATPDRLSGSDAAALAEAFAEAERIAAAGKALYGTRVKATDAYRTAGHRDAATWFAGISGDPVGRARGILDTTDALAKSPAARAALAGGELSTAQAQMIGSATAVDPSAGAELVALARRGSFRELRDGVSRARRRSRSEADEAGRERRVHERRYCRITEPYAGGLRIDAWVTKADGARLLARLDAESELVFKEAWTAGHREPHERYRADALVRLADTGRRWPAGATRARPGRRRRVGSRSGGRRRGLRDPRRRAGTGGDGSGPSRRRAPHRARHRWRRRPDGDVDLSHRPPACPDRPGRTRPRLRRPGLSGQRPPADRPLARRLRQGRTDSAGQPGPAVRTAPRHEDQRRLAAGRRSGSLAVVGA